MVLVITPYLRIHRKAKESKAIDLFRIEKIRRNPATTALAKLLCLRHRGFDRVSAGCHAGDRVGPKGEPSMFRDSTFF